MTEYCEICGCNGGGVLMPNDPGCETVPVCAPCLTRLREVEEAAAWLVECSNSWGADECPANEDAEWEFLYTLEEAAAALARLVG